MMLVEGRGSHGQHRVSRNKSEWNDPGQLVCCSERGALMRWRFGALPPHHTLDRRICAGKGVPPSHACTYVQGYLAHKKRHTP